MNLGTTAFIHRVVLLVVSVLLFLQLPLAEKYHLKDVDGRIAMIDIDETRHSDQIAAQLRQACHQNMSHQYVHECERTIHCHLLAKDPSTSHLCSESYHRDMYDDLLGADYRHRSDPKYRYSSHTCIGSAQSINQQHLRTSNHRNKFANTNDPSFHTCKFHNVCLLYGTYPTFVYFVDPKASRHLPPVFQLAHLPPSRQLHLGYFSEYYGADRNKPFMPIIFINETLPEDAFLHADDVRVGFLAAHSWPNYGHILFDNFISAFTGAMMYQIPFEKIQLIFESECLKFASLNPLGPSPSYGGEGFTNQMECLKHIQELNHYLLDHNHIFLDQSHRTGTRLCYRTLIAGHSSAFGQKAWDLSRDLSLRTFRDYVVKRFQEQQFLPPRAADDTDSVIVVLLRGDGLTMTSGHKDHLNTMLCSGTKEALTWLELTDDYRVECHYPQNMTFPQEVQLAQRAKIVVSFHGTISYTSLFVRDGTQVIIITEDRPNEYGKDYHIYSRITYFNTLWLSFEKFREEYISIVEHAIRLQNV